MLNHVEFSNDEKTVGTICLYGREFRFDISQPDDFIVLHKLDGTLVVTDERERRNLYAYVIYRRSVELGYA